MESSGSTLDAALLEPHLQGLFAFAYSLTRDRDAAQDAVQDTLLKAMTAKSAPADASKLRVWLFRILRNTWIDGVRRRRREEAGQEALKHEASEWQARGAAGGEGRLVDRIALTEAFQGLSEDHRAVLSLVDVSGMTYDETAEVLGIPRGTVMSRIARGRQAMVQALRAGSGEGAPHAGSNVTVLRPGTSAGIK